MNPNEALVSELRKYLSSAQYTSNRHESEQVQALKRDLNLAARVGQQLLMQLQAAEKSKEASEHQFQRLKLSNARLLEENQRLAAEHGFLIDSVEAQEAEISSLNARLSEASARANRLNQSAAAARALEKEVQILERMQSDLRAELESSTIQRAAAEKLARNLAQNLARKVITDYDELRISVGPNPLIEPLPSTIAGDESDSPSAELVQSTPGEQDEVPARGTSDAVTPVAIAADAAAPVAVGEPKNEATLQNTINGSMPQLTMDSTEDMSIDDSMMIKPTDTATPLRRPQRPRALSHESIFAVAPDPILPPFSTGVSKYDSRLEPLAVTGVSSQPSMAHAMRDKTASNPKTSARDRLSQMTIEDRRPKDHRRWKFALR